VKVVLKEQQLDISRNETSAMNCDKLKKTKLQISPKACINYFANSQKLYLSVSFSEHFTCFFWWIQKQTGY